MFTGIIEEVGQVKSIKEGTISSSILVEASKVLENTKIGDSICTNGVCLTVIEINKNEFKADVMAETLRRSNLGSLKKGSKVNLERALTLQTPLGGHLVSGHIDGVGKIIEIKPEDNATWFYIELDKKLLRYVVEKGSIAIDGISLTVAYVDNRGFKVSIIPHTSKETILLTKKVSEEVNIECDIVGKYIEKLLIPKEKEKKSNIDMNFLINNGFM